MSKLRQQVLVTLSENEIAFLARLRGEHGVNSGIILSDQQLIRAAIKCFMDFYEWKPTKKDLDNNAVKFADIVKFFNEKRRKTAATSHDAKKEESP
jgi:hypothetical protein